MRLLTFSGNCYFFIFFWSEESVKQKKNPILNLPRLLTIVKLKMDAVGFELTVSQKAEYESNVLPLDHGDKTQNCLTYISSNSDADNRFGQEKVDFYGEVVLGGQLKTSS